MSRCGGPLRLAIRAKAVTILLTVLIGSPGIDLQLSRAQTPIPITPSGLGTQVSLSVTPPPGGVQYDITGGTRPGGGTNLFHSFGEFGVPTNNIANFLNDSALPTNNILGRVTGGNISNIFGSVQTTDFGNANLFLMNPAGFLFGPNATVNVGGMVAFTSADYLKLRDNARFNAIPNAAADALLTASPVAAFGFLGSNPGAITFLGSQFTVTEGTGISLVGGNINIEAGTLDDATVQPALLTAPGGKINLASISSPGELLVGSLEAAANVTGQSFSAMGTISISEGSVLDVSGDGGGTVRIRGGQFIMDQAAVIANTTDVNDGASTAISVNVTDGVLLDNQSALVAQATNAGRGGKIEIIGRTIDVAGTSVVYTASTDSGSPGNITATASESISVRGADQFGNPSEILSDSLFMASTGSIALRSPLITLEMGAVETRMFGFGAETRAGDIMIDTTNLNLNSGGMIRTVSGSDIAPSGNISVTAGEAVNLIGTNDFNTTSNITNENTNGGTGNISIQTGTLTLSDQARINSQTGFDTDPAAADTAKIAIAADSIALSTGSRIDVGGFYSDVGRLDLSAQTLTMSGVSAITTLSNASGASGLIMINVQDLSVSEGSQIVSSSGQGFGRGGDITVSATGSILVTGQGTDPFGGTLASGIFSNTMAGFEDPSFTGNAGNISITGHSIEVSTGARVDSSSQFFALGNAGNIDLMAPTITVNGATISTSTEFAGQAGSITLGADTVTLSNNGQLASSSSVRQTPFFDGEVIPLPSGNAGSVIIQGLASPAQSVLIDGPGSGIFTDTQGSGAGGNIFVDANSVTLQNGGTLSAETSGTNNGGDIQVDATAINLLTFASINTLSFLSDGSAGNISLKATQQITAVDAFLNTDAVGGTGLGGNTLLRAPTIGVNGGVLSATTSGTGHAGNVLLEGQQISLGASPFAVAQGADLFAGTFGSGHGGTVILRGLNGPSSHADNVTISGTTRIHTLTGSDGSAGDITINAAQFSLTHATLNADTFGSGGAGTITITATDHATVSGLFTTMSSSSDFGATGNAGQISVSAPTVMIENGGSISTNTTGEGTGGNINILASQSATMTNGSSISASSTGPGNAGNIMINAGQNYTSTESAVTTQAAHASGGNITVLATDMVQLTNSQLNASVQGSSTTVGGNIVIDPQFVILQNSQILAKATQGQGGNISITTGLLLADATNVIDASSQFGVNGTVTIQSPNAPASGKIQPLGKTPLQATSLLNQHCASLAGGEFSSFTVAGRDSLPTEPSSWLASPLYAAGVGEGLGVRGEGLEGDAPILSLRQIAPPGFLIQAFALDWSAGCQS